MKIHLPKFSIDSIFPFSVPGTKSCSSYTRLIVDLLKFKVSHLLYRKQVFCINILTFYENVHNTVRGNKINSRCNYYLVFCYSAYSTLHSWRSSVPWERRCTCYKVIKPFIMCLFAYRILWLSPGNGIGRYSWLSYYSQFVLCT